MIQRFFAGKRAPLAAAMVLALVGVGVSTQATQQGGQVQVPATLDDFFMPGTQPETIITEMGYAPNDCFICHGIDFAEQVEIAANWQGSMMGQSARDPLFYACLAIANQDVANGGDICLRCHTPAAWLEGRSVPTDGSTLTDFDRDGVACLVCHRMVDPVFKPGISPDEDFDILAEIDPLPTSPGTGNYIIDPYDRRRGPFDLINDPPHPGDINLLTKGLPAPQFVVSPFHQTSEMCATCHDVSNPAYTRQADDTYALGPIDEAHPTGDQFDMFPIERTYSEWANSDYVVGVDAGGRFGGNLPTTVVSSCQDCHMADRDGNGCIQGLPELGGQEVYPPRPDMPRHDFAGGNSWVRDAIKELTADRWPSDLIPGQEQFNANLDAGQQKSIELLQLAATLEAEQLGAGLDVRVINETGHKLPTGYPEGRRMWLNVQYFDSSDNLVAERGMYNFLTADLTTEDTTVYEAKLGMTEDVAMATGLEPGESFHFVLNNYYVKDNRIPPRGFTNAAYQAIQATPVGETYEDGQFWSDKKYLIDLDATKAVVNLYYQTSSKEYIEFLRDQNVTNDWGDTLFALWENHGKGAPVLMASTMVDLTNFTPGDLDGDDDNDVFDFERFDACFTGPGATQLDDGCAVFDFDVDQDVDKADLAEMQLFNTGSL